MKLQDQVLMPERQYITNQLFVYTFFWKLLDT
jgi:hypothetical protein